MKKLLFIIFFMPSICFAQARLGYNEQYIRNEFSEYSFGAGYLKTGEKYISAQMDHGTFAYYFNEYNLCYMCVCLPGFRDDVNYYVKKFNSDYVPTGNDTWKVYLQNGEVMKIYMSYETHDAGSLYVIHYTY